MSVFETYSDQVVVLRVKLTHCGFENIPKMDHMFKVIKHAIKPVPRDADKRPTNGGRILF